jgi:pimeloyl-ACP methyl ester carboxylesterase
MIMTIMAGLLAAAPITTPGPVGDIHGTLIDAGSKAPTVLIIPGSGPTDRDGNNPMGVKAAPYRLLAEGLAERGISSVRADKRGLFASKDAVADAKAVTLADYAKDAHGWAKTLRARTGAGCIWLVGHSEGGLVALKAAQDSSGICGVVLVATPGRRMGDVLREQLRSNPANAPLLGSALTAIAALEAGRRVDVTGMNPALLPLFAPQVQGYLIDLMAADPALLAKSLAVPLLIIHGVEDLQVAEADANALHNAQSKSRLVSIAGMNHVLKQVPAGDRAANFAAYADSAKPIDPTLVETIVSFVLR